MRSDLALRKLQWVASVPPDTVPRPIVTSVEPDEAITPFVHVVLRGDWFQYPREPELATYFVTAIEFGGVRAVNLEVVDAFTLECDVQASALGENVLVRVFSEGGSAIGFTSVFAFTEAGYGRMAFGRGPFGG